MHGRFGRGPSPDSHATSSGPPARADSKLVDKSAADPADSVEKPSNVYQRTPSGLPREAARAHLVSITMPGESVDDWGVVPDTE